MSQREIFGSGRYLLVCRSRLATVWRLRSSDFFIDRCPGWRFNRPTENPAENRAQNPAELPMQKYYKKRFQF